MLTNHVTILYLRREGKPHEEVEREKKSHENFPVVFDDAWKLIRKSRHNGLGTPELKHETVEIQDLYTMKFWIVQ